ncbi:acyloxyacyl hydrolase [Lutibacter sp. B1]|uniref:acyloxyacyl hydrolase n=1 Tax=Lutibacter sp. B1 TaxID=2725996 RepID=UPI0014570945|nr:acyloxyacyl hydrolase [Lutibacter sp. B1]NLP58862.1 acyloxyacyl hydrolase [Lutibacter sp. B1]
MKKYYVIFPVLFLTFKTFSQNTTLRYSNFQTDLFIGIPIEHDKSLDKAIQGNAYGFLLSWNKVNSKNNKFNLLYNYPERGYSFLYQNLNSDILGEVYGGYRHFTYNLTPKRKNHLKLTTAFGLGYATKSYDEIHNDQNFAHGSKLLVSAYLKLQYFKLLERERLSLNTGMSLIHFSNISFKNPNLGLNTITFNLGINYKLEPVEISIPQEIENKENIDTSIHYNLTLRGGYNESKIIDSGLYPFYTVSFYGSKALNNYSTLTAGIDFFDAKFLKEYIKQQNENNGSNYNESAYRRVGVFVGHELPQHNFIFVTQIGVMVYEPHFYVSSVYERFGFKYKLSNHWFSEVTMKVNLFRAEALELGIGYKF